MTSRDYAQLAIFLGLLLLTAKPLGLHMMKVFEGRKTFLHGIFGPLERFIYRVLRINPNEDQAWSRYAIDLLAFSAVSMAFTYLLLRAQSILPLNPQKLGEVDWHLAFNTAVSFTTNTNWQSYGGESTMSYLSQMVALALHNFFSAAVGIAVALALIRGLVRKESKGIGNFWADMVRAHLYILLPLSIIAAVFLISQGIPQNFRPYTEATTLEGAKQVIGQGPVASQIAIKMLGTNGGGFFNANAAHPFENPTPLSNFFQMFLIFLIPSSLVYVLGASAQHKKHGWSVWSAMAVLFVAGALVCSHFEYKGSPILTQAGASCPVNMEGKETRFGIFNSALFATITTDASCGAVNAMHDSFTPIGGLVPLVNMQLGEVVFGGVGAGLYGMVLFIILSVFIAGLMVGRTPEYLGKKIEGREVKYAMLAIFATAFPILGFSAIAAVYPEALKGLNNGNAHGLSEIVYAFTSAAANNGSAFAGLTANAPWWDVFLSFGMFYGRFFIIIPMLAVAGSMAGKKPRVDREGSFPVHGPLFVTLLIGVILIVGALTFLPALSLGPIIEHFQMHQGQLF